MRWLNWYLAVSIILARYRKHHNGVVLSALQTSFRMLHRDNISFRFPRNSKAFDNWRHVISLLHAQWCDLEARILNNNTVLCIEKIPEHDSLWDIECRPFVDASETSVVKLKVCLINVSSWLTTLQNTTKTTEVKLPYSKY